MMKFLWRSHKPAVHASCRWHRSEVLPEVRYAVRRASLGERIELVSRIQELLLRNEFLAAGEQHEQLQAAKNDLLVRKVYIEWGLLEVRNLKIDGQSATPELIVRSGPEALSNEIVESIKGELGLTENERKNS